MHVRRIEKRSARAVFSAFLRFSASEVVPVGRRGEKCEALMSRLQTRPQDILDQQEVHACVSRHSINDKTTAKKKN